MKWMGGTRSAPTLRSFHPHVTRRGGCPANPVGESMFSNARHLTLACGRGSRSTAAAAKGSAQLTPACLASLPPRMTTRTSGPTRYSTRYSTIHASLETERRPPPLQSTQLAVHTAMLASNRNSTFGGIPDPRSPPQPQSPQSHPPSHPPPPASYSGHHQHAQSAHMPIGSPPDARNYPGSLSSARTRTSSTQGDPPATGSDFRPSMRGAPMPTRSQSLRPLSAFQPLDNPDSYNGNGTSSPVLSGGPGSPRPPSPNGSVARSIRPATAPLTFKSPDLRNALALQDAQGRKTYMEGYLLRRDEQGADGKPLHVGDERRRWNLCFVQLGGTVLSIWSVQQMEDAAREGREVPPAYINVTDSVSAACQSA